MAARSLTSMMPRLTEATNPCMTDINDLTRATGAETYATKRKSPIPATETKYSSVVHLKSHYRVSSVVLTYGTFGEVQKVKCSIKSFVSEAHPEQYHFISVVKSHYWIFRHVDELVRGFSLQNCCVQIQPMAHDVDGHGELEPKHVFWIEVGEGDAQAHGARSIGQLIQHSSESGT